MQPTENPNTAALWLVNSVTCGLQYFVADSVAEVIEEVKYNASIFRIEKMHSVELAAALVERARRGA